MGKQTKIERVVDITQAVLQLVDEKKLYLAKDVEALQDRIRELEATVKLLEAEQPTIPQDHKNIRGKEYYK